MNRRRQKMDYLDYEVKSNFIRDTLKGRKYTEQGFEFLKDLATIEKLALGESFGLATGYMFLHLKNQYPKAFREIFRELAPEKYQVIIADDEDNKKRNEEFLEQTRKENEVKRKKDFWERAGGVV